MGQVVVQKSFVVLPVERVVDPNHTGAGEYCHARIRKTGSW